MLTLLNPQARLAARVWLLIIATFFLNSSVEAKTRIVFWHSMSGDKGRLMLQLIDDFNKSNTQGILVQPQFVGSYPEGINKLRTAFMGRRAPHVAQIYEIGTQVMLDSRIILPLQDFIDQDSSFSSDELLAEIRRYYEINGRLYSLPFATSTPVLYYNKDLFLKHKIDSLPKDFQSFRQIATKLTDTKKGRTGVTWPLHSWFFEQFMALQGVELANHQNGRKARASSVFYDASQGEAFVALWRDLVSSGVMTNVGRGWAPALQNFLASRSAMLLYSSSDIFEIPRRASFSVGVAPLFAQHDKQKPGGVILGGNSLWLIKGKPEAETKAAYEFMKHMASPATQRRWHTETGYFPIRQDVIDTLTREGFYEEHPHGKVAINQLRAAAIVPASQGALLGVFPEAREHIEFAIEEVLANRSEPAQALQRAKARTKSALERYNRMYLEP